MDIAVCQNPNHDNQRLKYICVDPNCQVQKKIGCADCFLDDHITHIRKTTTQFKEQVSQSIETISQIEFEKMYCSPQKDLDSRIDFELENCIDYVWKFQKFICIEIEKIIDQYVTLPSCDTLSLYEIYQESTKHYEVLLKFHQFASTTTDIPRECHFNNVNLQEFLGFVSKLKLLNLPNFKKKIKVPNKGDPGMGIPTRNPKVRHLKHQSNQFLVNDSDSSDSEDVADINPQINQKIKNKNGHLRGESTFQQKYK
ncbi:unnamed protein product [Paramecium sonneborni]|uniref:Uncharacterized protein n=1 Tax=Paramecium sonneborni TaxID=65129 RepID=A0A8S1R0S8_9CILI|nr:unnamed protein product [Paramecium sonneborni]